MTGPFPQVARVAAGSAVLTRRHGRWLLAGGWKSAIGRVLGSVMAAWMLGGCAIATPVTWWVAVFTWVVAAYRVSDSSATPPPLPLASIRMNTQVRQRKLTASSGARKGLGAPSTQCVGGERAVIRRLLIAAADFAYCEVCGWWYPPHSH